jgi:putative RecB family exonuclease
VDDGPPSDGGVRLRVVTDQQQLALGGLPRRLLRATPSRLATFSDCPRRYLLTYLTRPPPPRGPAWAHTTVGAAVHLALARWYSEPVQRRTPATAGALLVAAWQKDGFASDAQAQDWRQRARGWVESYVATLDPDEDPPGVERTVATKLEGIAMSGRIDRLDDRDGQLVVVDYKTGRWVPDDDGARSSQPLALYAIAAGRTMRRPCTRVELHHLPTGTVAAADHDRESFQRHVDRAAALAADVVLAQDTLEAGGPREALFPCSPSPRCSWCTYRPICEEGRAASTEREPWSARAEPEPSPVDDI